MTYSAPNKMPRDGAVEIRTWRAWLIRKRTEYLGRVKAPDRETAEVAAVEKFKLNDEQRRRLVLREKLPG